jgi:hypothetical protein
VVLSVQVEFEFVRRSFHSHVFGSVFSVGTIWRGDLSLVAAALCVAGAPQHYSFNGTIRLLIAFSLEHQCPKRLTFIVFWSSMLVPNGGVWLRRSALATAAPPRCSFVHRTVQSGGQRLPRWPSIAPETNNRPTRNDNKCAARFSIGAWPPRERVHVRCVSVCALCCVRALL